jgi:uncharacterized damage-inducible protein DinB
MIGTIIPQLQTLLQQLDKEHYSKPSVQLNGSTIGQHVRHSVEMYQCLIHGYVLEQVDYSKRKRDTLIETLPDYALLCLEAILTQMPNADKQVYLMSETEAVLSSFKRELLYCNEHLIHHMALIRVAVQELGDYDLPAAFGVAPSTLKYRKECAQ